MKNRITIMLAIATMAILFGCKDHSDENDGQVSNTVDPATQPDPRFGKEYYKVYISPAAMTFTGKKADEFSTDPLVDHYMQKLDTFFDPRLANEINAVRAKREAYKKFLREAFSNTEGMSLDFIAQTHSLTEMKRLPPEVIWSQLQTKTILDSMHYDAVGWESSAIEDLTPTLFMDETKRHIAAMGGDASRMNDSDFYKAQPSDAPEDAIQAAWFENHSLPIVGTQDESIWWLDLQAEKLYGAETPLFTYTATFRGYVAIAKVLHYMKKHHCKHGVLILGMKHSVQAAYCAQHLGLKMRIWNTSDKTEFDNLFR